MIDFHIDCETLSIAHNPVILTIGCAAAPRGKKAPRYDFETAVPITEQIELGAIVDDATFLWWLEQDEAARESLRRLYIRPNAPNTVGAACTQLWQFFQKIADFMNDDDLTVWSYGANADLAWLKFLSDSIEMPLPWSYRQERCLRTFMAENDPDDKLRPTNPVEHDALSDAAHQLDWMVAVREAMNAKDAR